MHPVVEGCDCTLKTWYQDLSKEYNSLSITRAKLERSVQLLNSTLPSSSILTIRNKQLKKIVDALDSLNIEMNVISTACINNSAYTCNQTATNNTSTSNSNSPSNTNNINLTGQSVYLSFDQGNVVDEVSSSSYTLSSSGVTFSSTNGKSSNGKYAIFDGVSGYAMSANIVEFGDGSSMSMWIRKNNVAAPNGGMPWSFDPAPGYFQFDVGGGAAFRVYNADNNIILTSPTIFNTDTWHHVVLVCRLDGSDLYIDGQLHQTTTTKFGLRTNAKLRIGNYFVAGYQFNGALDDFRIINRVLTATEVDSIYKAR